MLIGVIRYVVDEDCLAHIASSFPVDVSGVVLTIHMILLCLYI